MKKEFKLKELIKAYSPLAIAFSGGTDSSLLAKIAFDVIGDKLLLIHARSVFSPVQESAFAMEWATKNHLRIKLLELDPLSAPNIKKNCAKRCYHCKRLIMEAIKNTAREEGIENVADGTNTDDYSDYRPGLQATQELGIIHPLAEAELGKRHIRQLARKYKLPNWRKPASACLASRIPHDTPLDAETLKRADKAETFLRGLGFEGCRARILNPTSAKIEINPLHFRSFTQKRKEIEAFLHSLGFQEIFLSEYKRGSLNP